MSLWTSWSYLLAMRDERTLLETTNQLKTKLCEVNMERLPSLVFLSLLLPSLSAN